VGIAPEKKKGKKEKGINVVYGFSHIFSIKWINSLLCLNHLFICIDLISLL
jgi:hypothetical protein